MLTMLVICSALGISYASNIFEEDDSDVIIVDVIYNSYDEEYIKNIVLDDGTKIGDHEYVINYTEVDPIAPQSDDSSSGSWGGYFSYAAWITRDGIVSLSLQPLSSVRYNWTKAEAAWSAILSSSFKSSSYWNNTNSMYWQYKCHFDVVPGKTYWNLEPAYSASSYAQVVLAQCNPR